MKHSLLTILRDKNTRMPAFRLAAKKLSDLIAAEAAAVYPEKTQPVTTPLGKANGKITIEDPIILPILRAGMAMFPSFLHFFPNARVGFYGIRREEKTLHHELYYENLPRMRAKDLILILDPMIATGGSSLLVIKSLVSKKIKPTNITIHSILSATQGIRRIQEIYPSVKIHSVATDTKLNMKKFIIPGLGDFGDRFFGT